MVDLWIKGDARSLMDHYFESDYSKIYMAMTVTESGPVSLSDKYSAFTIPIMDSGSVFKGYYGFVFQGIWNLTQTLSEINMDLGLILGFLQPLWVKTWIKKSWWSPTVKKSGFILMT